MTYTIRVGALPADGGDRVYSTAQILKPQPNTEAPTATPEPTPTPVPTPEPTEAPTPTPTPVPTVANVGAPVIVVDGTSFMQDGVTYMTGDSVILSWSADGAVQSYTVYVENQNGDRVNLGTTTDTSRAVNTATLPAGTYTIYVGALPVNGGESDMVWSSYRFALAAVTTVPTAVPTQAPTQVPEETPVAPTQPPIDLNTPVTVYSDSETIQ